MTLSAAAPTSWSPSKLSIPAGVPRTIFAVVATLMATSAFYGLFTGARPETNPGEIVEVSARGNTAYVAVWLVVYGTSGLLVLRDTWRRGLDVRLALLCPFALYIVASATWSVSPWRSIVFCAMLALNIVIAAALASRFHPAILLALIAKMTTALVAISLALLVVDPTLVVSTPDRPGLLMVGELFGVFGHKVALGTYAALALLVVLFSPDGFPRPLTRWLAIATCAVGLALSNSASAVVALVISAILLSGARLVAASRRWILRVPLAAVVVVSIALPFVEAGGFAELLGRPPTLTGRTSFWTLAPVFILKRPYFGYGYGGFFDHDAYSPVWDLWATAEWFFTPNFHNSALDVTITLGVVGLAAYVAVLLSAGAVQANRTLGRSADLLTAVVVLLAVTSATDFQLMRHNALPTILMFYAFMVAGRRYNGGAQP
jgi:O-antigen ligase